MTRRGLLALPFLALVFALGRSVGNVLYDMLFYLLLLLFVFSGLSALQLKLTGRVQVSLSEREVRRGESVDIDVRVRQRCFFPAGGCDLQFQYGYEKQRTQMRLRPFREDRMRITVTAVHVGRWVYSVEYAEGQDLFGLFRVRLRPKDHPFLLVLPRPFDVEKPEFLFSDQGRTARSRGQEDLTSPEAVRTWRPGDPLKRVHWKLSARRQELQVRTYETPAPPDTLILMDICAPEAERTEDALILRDVLCETCDAVADMQLRDASPVRIPFYERGAGEFRADTPSRALLLQETLASLSFSGTYDFEKALLMELQRLETCGAVIIVTTRMTPGIADAVNSIRRMGPSVRYYYVSHQPDEERLRPMITGMQRQLVEVCYVTPA